MNLKIVIVNTRIITPALGTSQDKNLDTAEWLEIIILSNVDLIATVHLWSFVN